MGEGSRQETPVALVSGANRGIGAEIAGELAAEHSFLVFAGARDPTQIAPSSASPAEAASVAPIELDVTNQASVDAARDQIESEVGYLDALINNAGIYGDSTGAPSTTSTGPTRCSRSTRS